MNTTKPTENKPIDSVLANLNSVMRRESCRLASLLRTLIRAFDVLLHLKKNLSSLYIRNFKNLHIAHLFGSAVRLCKTSKFSHDAAHIRTFENGNIRKVALTRSFA